MPSPGVEAMTYLCPQPAGTFHSDTLIAKTYASTYLLFNGVPLPMIYYVELSI